jgi:hypothetical protein
VLLRNRDWTVSIECRADSVMVYPGGQRFRADDLVRAVGASNPLLDAVRQMVARRQALVRPGEPPYRIQLRFQVRSDGLRTYYLAYPTLDILHLPMTRENLDSEEDVKPRSFGN